MKPIAVYDGNTRRRLCYLPNAYDISYIKTATALWTASFTLPYNDPKNKYCESMNLVNVWDVDGSGKDKYIGLFRIMPSESTIGMGASTITYNLEHVLATLIDDVMLGWVEIGNTGVYTATVINYILSRQAVRRWVLGACDYNHQFLYGWQDENLLSALYSVTNAFIEDDFRWEFETKNYPWTLSLKRVSTAAVTDVRYRKNIDGIKKTIDPTNLTTRLYCYGFGEADNRLDIRRVNNNIPYIDSPNISKYGVLTRVWTDERFTNDASLLQSGKAMLASLENPLVSYDIDIATVHRAADLEAGDMVRVVDEEVDIYTRVVEVSKDDVSGQPLIGKVVLANKDTDIAQSVADMADRHRIATTYAQGAESLFADSLYDNADPANPAELTFWVPNNAVHVNEILLTCRTSAFRSFSRATQGGGATTQTSTSGGASVEASASGGASTQATSSGGGNYTSTENGGNTTQATSSGGGSYTSTDSGGNTTQATSSGGGSYTSTENGGSNSLTSGSGGYSSETTQNSGGTSETSEGTVLEPSNIQANQGYYNRANHNHGIPEGSFMARNVYLRAVDLPPDMGGGRIYGITSYETVDFVASGAHTHGAHNHRFTSPIHSHNITIPSHQHNVNIPGHNHNITIPNHQHSVSIPSHNHSITIPNHQHSVNIPGHNHNINIPNHEHSVSIPSHQHNVSIPGHTHNLSLPNHTHDIEHGIYKGGSASSFTVAIDGVTIGTYSYSVSNLNLIAHMSKNANGEVLRGQHTIKITPNALTRIECAIQIRLFTNARGAGQF